MKITIHHNSNHIGGCVTEYESNGCKLFIGYGGQISKIHFTTGVRFSFGEFEITPIEIDHSASDTYAFCIEAEKLKVIHIGGYRGGKLFKYIEKYVGRADYVVCEAIDSDYRCDMNSLNELFSALQPKAVIPIPTDNPRAFADLFCDKWPVILLNDRETFSAIKDGWYDTTVAKIFAHQHCFLDKRILGEFESRKDAEFALHHVVYAPNRLLAYSIESNEDMSPLLYTVYTPDFTKYSEYSEGGRLSRYLVGISEKLGDTEKEEFLVGNTSEVGSKEFDFGIE